MNPAQPSWSQIEETGTPEYFVAYLDAVTAQSEMRRYKRKTYQLVGASPGARLLDIGCGTGDDVRALADLVGAGGQVVGLDFSSAIVEEARRRVGGTTMPIELRVGDVHALDLPDDGFDGCRADRVFMHLADPARALAEMIRVTRPGGRIVVREPDWDTLAVDSPERDLTRRILQQHFDRVIRHGWSGRQLYRLFHQAGLGRVTVADTSTLILTDFATANQFYGLEAAAALLQQSEPALAERAAAWLAQLKQADAEGRFFSAVTGFTVAGEKAPAHQSRRW